MKPGFDLSERERSQLLEYLIPELEHFYQETGSLRASPRLDPLKVIQAVRAFDLEHPVEGQKALRAVMEGMTAHAVHTPHPMYFGLYNPRANFAGILADLITAVLNPQLAAWSHSPYANEVEKYLVELFGLRFGYPKDRIDGVFAGGGAEANFTALLCALNHAFPRLGELGLQGIGESPVIYCSEETHHSILKGARMAGLGSGCVRMIPVKRNFKMDVDQLRLRLKTDRESGKKPFMVVATAGTTGTGTIDELEIIGQLCREHALWFHVDAAYGGAVVTNPVFRHWIRGTELSHSLIMDLHKWFSVPMAASMLITRDPEILHHTFRIKTDYMPGDARNLSVTDPFSHSFQWSRRFSGLKLYLSLLMFGMEGYAEVIGQQVETGNILRGLLKASGWRILNDTPLPVVCFTDHTSGGDHGFSRYICDAIVASGAAWISVYQTGGLEMLRACITNYNTGKEQVEHLVGLLGHARERWRKQPEFIS